jgi:hypothetical protein
MSENEPQTLKDEYSRATKILDAGCKPASLDDVIKTCENLHVEEQHQLKTLLQKYEHLFDGTLGEFNMDTIPISLQLMDPNCKPIHACAYTVSRSVEQQLQPSKEIVRLVDIGILEEDYSSEWASYIQSFAIPKKNGTIRVVTDFRKLNLLLKYPMSLFSYSKDWGRNSSFKDHLLKLEMVLARLSTTGMRVNISKSKFFAEQIEYLGY